MSQRRLYDRILADHVAQRRQMAFVVGPRQVGKTTSSRSCADQYLDWDVLEHREQITGGQEALLQRLGLGVPRPAPLPVLALDEFHKHPR